MVGLNAHNEIMTIMIVDTFKGIHSLYKALVEDNNVCLLYANNTSEIPERINKDHIDMVFTTLSSGGINGVRLAEELNRTHPNMPILFLTLDTERAETILDGELPSNVRGLFAKPSTTQELHNLIQIGMKNKVKGAQDGKNC